MSDDHHPEISEDRLFFVEQQEIVVDKIDASGYILDIGGGGEGIIGRLAGEQVIAIDPNRRELEEAADGPLKIVMDATDLKFLDDAFSVVTAFFTLMYIKGDDHRQIFEEVFRILVSRGRFLVWDVEFPPRADEEKDILVFPLTVKLPVEEVSTGYGMHWPDEGREISHYVQLAEDVGFKVAAQEKIGRTVYLELQKS